MTVTKPWLWLLGIFPAEGEGTGGMDDEGAAPQDLPVTTVTSDHPVPYCPIASTRSPSVYSMYSPFPFLSICLVAPPIGERAVQSVSLYDYLICFLSCFR